jgi:hypothetical protein
VNLPGVCLESILERVFHALPTLAARVVGPDDTRHPSKFPRNIYVAGSIRSPFNPLQIGGNKWHSDTLPELNASRTQGSARLERGRRCRNRNVARNLLRHRGDPVAA